MILDEEFEDQECDVIREKLIGKGTIIPGNVKTEREKLIDKGNIIPGLCELIVSTEEHKCKNEEGEYIEHSINKDNYLSRKTAYFRVLQEVLFSREQ